MNNILNNNLTELNSLLTNINNLSNNINNFTNFQEDTFDELEVQRYNEERDYRITQLPRYKYSTYLKMKPKNKQE
jgi:hypothetical protein